MGYWSGIKVFYGPRLVGFWLNLAAGDTLEHWVNNTRRAAFGALAHHLHHHFDSLNQSVPFAHTTFNKLFLKQIRQSY